MFTFLSAVIFIIFAVKRLMSYLHIYQQEDYDPKRLIKWMRNTAAIDKKFSACLLFLTFLRFFVSQITISAFIVALTVFFILKEQNPLKKAKKPLVLTDRAKRMLGLAVGLMAVATLVTANYFNTPLGWLILVQLIPFALIAATKILQPYELRVNNGFRRQAIDLLNSVNPFVIGVTGSYGKTSVKHILGHILNYLSPTLYTPGSVNTEMGIVRVIREQLKTHHKFFIVEMGAYGIGSIARLCRLTPPRLSVITAIGAAHFERFKTLNDTARAKFEIAEAAVAQNGKTIIHESVLAQEYAKEFYDKHKDACIVCGKDGDVKINDVRQTKGGLQIDITHKGTSHMLKAPLYGTHQAGNIVLAFAVAAELNMPVEDIITAIQSLPQIKHRLEVKDVGLYKIIDDAYNSNPEGFEAALRTLDLLGRETRRILITPGIVELGDKHDVEHARLGTIAAACTDIVIAVKADRIGPFVNAVKVNPSVQTLAVESFAEAQAWLNTHTKPGDVVLLENDLPDLYEKKLLI